MKIGSWGLLAVTLPMGMPVTAQVYDLPTLAQSQVIGATAKNQARRSAARRSGGPTADQAEACAGLPRYRREYGAKHPQVRQLERLCRGAGL